MPLLFLLFLLFLCPNALAAEQQLPRTVIALYDSHITPNLEQSMAHSMAEMPLNHLGVTLEYHDINAPLPTIAKRQDVRGILSWFHTETRIPNPGLYLRWAVEAIDAGKQFALLGNPGFYENTKGQRTSINLINAFFAKLGLHTDLAWVDLTYNTHLSYENTGMFLPGRHIGGIKPSYMQLSAIGNSTSSYLVAHSAEGNSQLVVTNAHGGYIADGYSHSFHNGKEEEIREWYVNPFRFFDVVFKTDNLPKPDTTTVAGKRLFYSHIDGDGWNNYSQIEAYKKQHFLASEVIMERVAKAYPDLPVTLTLIGADIDPHWSGTSESTRIARAFFALPNVEAGSHTYSHPFYWDFFADGNWQKEQPYLHLYPDGSWDSSHIGEPPPEGQLPHGYTTPRAYAREPFDINKEISGSIRAITPLLPPDKKVEILTWPGNCLPWDKAVGLARTAGVHNINGGDSRFDSEYPFYASVAPLGRQVGSERQIYASSSNENTYTNLWNGRFFGFRLLVESLKNTETPLRIKPLNVYYHIYSGEKEASLNAVLANLDYAKSADISPVTASHFTAITEGFYNTRLTLLGADRWRVENRGALDTIRFDHALFKAVDFTRSDGVVGQRHFQGSLYVYLDSTVRAPVIALTTTALLGKEAEANTAYLIKSRWQVQGLAQNGNSFRFTASGFGNGDMLWQVPENGRYRVTVAGQKQTLTATDKQLALLLKTAALHPVDVAVEKIE